MSFACEGCNTPLPALKRPGRPRKWCSDSCRVSTIRGFTRRVGECRGCGTTFVTRRQFRRFCTSQCGWRYRAALTSKPARSSRCAVCGDNFTTKQPSQIYCDRVCHERARRARRGDNRRRRVPKSVRQRILRRDQWCCYLCQRSIPRDVLWPHPLSGTVDHVKPTSAGGTDDPANLRAAHWHCNEEKGDRLLGIEMGFSVGAAA